MLLEDKVVVVTGGNSGIGAAICEVAGREGAKVVVDYVTRPQDAQAVDDEVTHEGSEAISVDADVSKVDDLQPPRRRGGHGIRPHRRVGQQRRHRDAHVPARHRRGRLRPGARDQPQERLLRQPARGEAVHRPGWRRRHRQRDLGARGLADAGQHPLLRQQGRHADADPHRRRGARAARHPRRRRRTRAPSTPRSTPRRPPTRRSWPPSTRRSRCGASPSRRRSPRRVVFLASDRAAYATATTVFLDGGIMQGSVGL